MKKLSQKELEKVNLTLSFFSLPPIRTIERFSHEDTISSRVYLLEFASKEKLILKIPFSKKRYENEIHFLKKLKGKLPVPDIIDSIAPKNNQFGAILMQYIEGDILKASHLTTSQSFSMGKLLGKLHNIDCQSKEEPLEILTRIFHE